MKQVMSIIPLWLGRHHRILSGLGDPELHRGLGLDLDRFFGRRIAADAGHRRHHRILSGFGSRNFTVVLALILIVYPVADASRSSRLHEFAQTWNRKLTQLSGLRVVAVSMSKLKKPATCFGGTSS